MKCTRCECFLLEKPFYLCDHQNLRLDPLDVRLDPRKFQELRIKSRVQRIKPRVTVNLLLSSTVCESVCFGHKAILSSDACKKEINEKSMKYRYLFLDYLQQPFFFCFCQTYELPDPVRILLRSGTDREDRKFWKRFGRQNEFYKDLGKSNVYSQGAKKIIFTACHLGKLKLAFTSPEIISTSPKSFLTSRIDFTVLFCSNSLKNSTPVGQVKNENHSLDSKIHQPWAIGHHCLCMLTVFFYHQR